MSSSRCPMNTGRRTCGLSGTSRRSRSPSLAAPPARSATKPSGAASYNSRRCARGLPAHPPYSTARAVDVGDERAHIPRRVAPRRAPATALHVVDVPSQPFGPVARAPLVQAVVRALARAHDRAARLDERGGSGGVAAARARVEREAARPRERVRREHELGRGRVHRVARGDERIARLRERRGGVAVGRRGTRQRSSRSGSRSRRSTSRRAGRRRRRPARRLRAAARAAPAPPRSRARRRRRSARGASVIAAFAATSSGICSSPCAFVVPALPTRPSIGACRTWSAMRAHAPAIAASAAARARRRPPRACPPASQGGRWCELDELRTRQRRVRFRAARRPSGGVASPRRRRTRSDDGTHATCSRRSPFSCFFTQESQMQILEKDARYLECQA